jgi:hypothetical protein
MSCKPVDHHGSEAGSEQPGDVHESYI